MDPLATKTRNIFRTPYPNNNSRMGPRYLFNMFALILVDYGPRDLRHKGHCSAKGGVCRSITYPDMFEVSGSWHESRRPKM